MIVVTRFGEASSRAVLLGGLLALLLSIVASMDVSAHPYHLFGGNPDTSQGQGVQTDSTIQIAQSFSIASPLTLTWVALNVSDVGASDNLTVQIVSDSAGTPSGSILASSSNRTGAGFKWANFTLGVWLNLSNGVTYWIVALSSASAGNGYSWWNSGYDANASGTAAQKLLLLPWTIRSDDFAFLLYGWRQTNATFVHRAASTTAVAGAETSFLLDLRVSGTDSAENVTIDYVYPSPYLTYSRDTSAGTGLGFGLSQFPNRLRYAVAQVAPGAYSFAIIFLVNHSIPAGTIETTTASMSYKDFLGVEGSVPGQSATVRILNVKVTFSAAVNASSADPGSPLEYWIAYATDPLNSTTVNDFRPSVRLAQGVTFRSASPGHVRDVANRTVTWTIPNLTAGSSGRVAVNVTVDVGLPPRLDLLTALSATYPDSPTTRAALLSTFVSTIVTAPVFSIDLRADRVIVRSGEIVSYSILLNNSGNGVAGDVWVNNTLDPRVVFYRARTVGTLTLRPGEVLWNISRLAPGLTTIGLDVQALSTIDDGAVVRDSVTLAYTDARGNPRTGASPPPVDLAVRAPRITVNLTLDKATVSSGSDVNETIVIRNVGTERAYRVWVNQTFGTFTRYIRDTNNVTPVFTGSPSGATYSWLTSTLDPGAQLSFIVSLRSVNDGESVALVDLRIEGTYTDAYGQGTGQGIAAFQSARLGLAIQAPSPFFSLKNPAFLALLASAAILGVASAMQAAFGRFRLEEMFFVRRDGTLVVHQSHRPSMNKDADLFAAMLTVIQDFVRDSFEYRPGQQLRQLSFGKLNGFIASGGLTYLAVMYVGRIGPVVRRALVRCVLDLEAKRGRVLAQWTGDPKQIEDITATLGAVIRVRPGFMIGLLPLRLPKDAKSANAA